MTFFLVRSRTWNIETLLPLIINMANHLVVNQSLSRITLVFFHFKLIHSWKYIWVVERLIGSNRLFFFLYTKFLSGILCNSPNSPVNKSNMRNLTLLTIWICLQKYTHIRMHKMLSSFICTSIKCHFENNSRTLVSKFEIDRFTHWLNLYPGLLQKSYSC